MVLHATISWFVSCSGRTISVWSINSTSSSGIVELCDFSLLCRELLFLACLFLSASAARSRPPLRETVYWHCFSDARHLVQCGCFASHLTCLDRHWRHASEERVCTRVGAFSLMVNYRLGIVEGWMENGWIVPGSQDRGNRVSVYPDFRTISLCQLGESDITRAWGYWMCEMIERRERLLDSIVAQSFQSQN